jgi:hypothetical protein
VTGKGVRDEELNVESFELKKEMSGELNAETLRTRRGEKRKGDPSLRSLRLRSGQAG